MISNIASLYLLEVPGRLPVSILFPGQGERNFLHWFTFSVAFQSCPPSPCMLLLLPGTGGENFLLHWFTFLFVFQSCCFLSPLFSSFPAGARTFYTSSLFGYVCSLVFLLLLSLFYCTLAVLLRSESKIATSAVV